MGGINVEAAEAAAGGRRRPRGEKRQRRSGLIFLAHSPTYGEPLEEEEEAVEEEKVKHFPEFPPKKGLITFTSLPLINCQLYLYTHGTLYWSAFPPIFPILRFLHPSHFFPAIFSLSLSWRFNCCCCCCCWLWTKNNRKGHNDAYFPEIQIPPGKSYLENSWPLQFAKKLSFFFTLLLCIFPP